MTQCEEQFLKICVMPSLTQEYITKTNRCIGMFLSSTFSRKFLWLDGFLKVCWREKSWLCSHPLVLVMLVLITFGTNRYQGYCNFQLSPFSCNFVILYFSLELFGYQFLSRAGKYLSILLLKLIYALDFVLAVSSTLHIHMLSLFHKSQSYWKFWGHSSFSLYTSVYIVSIYLVIQHQHMAFCLVVSLMILSTVFLSWIRGLISSRPFWFCFRVSNSLLNLSFPF